MTAFLPAPAGPSAVRSLAGAAAATSWEHAPAPVRQRVAELFGDIMADAALGSARAELMALVSAYAERTPSGAATVIGSSRGWPAAQAAFLNGSVIAADQLQDGHRLARGHPASHAVPAAFAIGEEIGADMGAVFSAVLAGYEVGVRIGRAMGGTPNGVHDIGTWGQVAAAVASSHLLARGDARAMCRAIELASAAVLLVDAATVFGGATGGHAFLGMSVQHGLTAAEAAVAGLETAPGALERHLMAVAAREPTALDIETDDDVWAHWEVMTGYVKVFPTCAHLHGVNEAIERLIADGLQADQIADVAVETFKGATMFGDVADSELGARFSIPTSVAIALATGRLDESTLTTATVQDDGVRDLAARVRVRHNPALDAGYPGGRPARVTVTLTDGSSHRAEVGLPRWDAKRWPDPTQLAGKRDRLLRARFAAKATSVTTLLDHLDERMAAREVGAVLRAAAT